MVDVEYANAYKEVLEILKFIPREDYNKVPENKIKLFEFKSNKEYDFSYNPNKTLIEQNVSKRARAIIAILFRDYWATPAQKEKILAKQRYDKEKIEEEKRKKYNPDNIFNTNKKVEIEETNDVFLPAEVKEKNIITRIFEYIKSLF